MTPELDLPLLAGRHRPGAVAAAPLEVDGGVVGVLEIYYARPRPADIPRRALRVCADLAGLSIAVALAQERERVWRVQLDTLEAASRALTTERTPDHVLRRIVEVAMQVAGARYGALGMAGPDGYLTAFITTGLSADERARIGALPRGHGLLGVLIREGQPLRVPAIQRDPRRVGFPPHHPPMTSLLGVPIRARHALVGSLYLTDKVEAPEFSEDDQHLIELLAAHAGIAIENARLYAQIGDLTLLRERERIGRDLHDGLIQDIYAGTLRLESLAEELPDAALREQLHAVAAHFSTVIGDVRTYIHGLRAPELQGRLLSAGLVALVQEVSGRAKLLTACTVEGEPSQLPDALASALVQITREALSNVIKHAGATQAHVSLVYAAHDVVLTVTDDGRGFDTGVAQGEEHRGLRNMRARVEDAGGTFRVVSTPGGGTTITVTVPRHA